MKFLLCLAGIFLISPNFVKGDTCPDGRKCFGQCCVDTRNGAQSYFCCNDDGIYSVYAPWWREHWGILIGSIIASILLSVALSLLLCCCWPACWCHKRRFGRRGDGDYYYGFDPPPIALGTVYITPGPPPHQYYPPPPPQPHGRGSPPPPWQSDNSSTASSRSNRVHFDSNPPPPPPVGPLPLKPALKKTNS